MIIGITGQSGCGKSTLSELFEEKGYFIIDCDKVYHNLMKTNQRMLEEIKDEFGESCFEDGILNRKELGKIVFADEKKLKKLNEITHKYVLNETEKLLENKENVIIDAPLLIEAGLHKACEISIYVYCPFETRVERIIKRDGISKEYAVSRLKAQPEDDFYRNACTFIVVNDGKADLYEQLKELFD